MATAQKNEVVSKVLSLYPEQIRVIPGFNVRKDMGDMKGLQNSIAESGVLQAVKVRKTKDLTDDQYPVYELVDGHRRYQAAAKQTEASGEYVMIPAEEIDGNSTETDLLVTMMATGMNNKELTMLERARGIARIITANEGIKDSQIAKMLGVSQPHVADCKLLLTAKPDTLKQVEKGAISASAIVDAIKAGDPDEVDAQLDKAIEKADRAGKEKVTGKDLGGKKKSAAARSTKKGVEEDKAGPVERVSPVAAAQNKLIGLEDSLSEQEDAGERNELAFAVLKGIIAFLGGKAEPMELLSMFYGDGKDLPTFATDEEEEVPAPKAAPKPSSKKSAEPKAVAKAEAPKRKSLKEQFAEIDAENGKKPAAPAKKSAAPKEAPAKKSVAKKSADLDDEDEDTAATKAASRNKKEDIPELDEEGDLDLDEFE